MKIAASIFLGIIALLLVQPLVAMNSSENDDCCSEDCCKKECPKKDDQGNKDCNPFTNCALCSLFLISRQPIAAANIVEVKEVFFIKNDNRIIQNLSECWHPPNRRI